MEKMFARARLAALVLCTGVAAGCGGPDTPAQAREARAAEGTGDIVIGVAWPWAAHPEIRLSEGLQLALDEVNAGGGVAGRPLRLVREDDGGSVTEGILAAQRLAADPDVMAVIGHLQSYVTVPASAVYDQNGIVLIAPTASAPELTAKGYTQVFRGTVSDAATGRQMAHFAGGRGYRRVAVYFVRNPYGRALANAFEESAARSGVNVVARASYDPSHRQDPVALEPLFREWREMGLDAVFLAGEGASAAVLAVEMRRMGIAVPILGSDAMAIPPFPGSGGEAVEGAIVPAPFHPDVPRPEVQRFVSAFRARFGADPDAGSALGYDAVHLLAAAMRKAGGASPAAVSEALRDLELSGVTGLIRFDQNGEMVERDLVKTVVRGGEFAFMAEPVLAARAP